MSDSSPPRPLTQIAIAVVESEGRFLVGQRPAGVALAGLWEFPGGKIEPGESPEEAAVRECLEETSLAVQALFRYPQREHDYSHAKVQLHFIACGWIASGRMVGDEQEPRAPFRWVPRGELRNYEFPAGNRELLAHLLGEGAA